MIPSVGTIIRSELGGPRFVVVGVDGRFVYVKGADEPKKNRTLAGARIIGLEEFAREWKVVS